MITEKWHARSVVRKLAPWAAALLLTPALPATAQAEGLDGYPGVEGVLITEASYNDPDGAHTVLLTFTPPYVTGRGTQASNNADVHAYDFVRQQGRLALKWKVLDYVHGCDLNTGLFAGFAPDAPIISDVDGDGWHEVWLPYYLGCHGDVSPDELKIIMYEKGRKHALRGHTRVEVDGGVYGGDYKADSNLSHAGRAIYDKAIEIFNAHRGATDINWGDPGVEEPGGDGDPGVDDGNVITW